MKFCYVLFSEHSLDSINAAWKFYISYPVGPVYAYKSIYDYNLPVLVFDSITFCSC